MSVYVDPMRKCVPNKNWKRSSSCHMFADDLDELHEMAEKVGLKREWFQDKSLPHYDLTENKRKQAVECGAKEVGPDRRDIVEHYKKCRKEDTPDSEDG